MKKSQKTTKENLEDRFESGKRILDYFDLETSVIRVNVDFPIWMVKALDKESTRRGVARQALVKMWIADKIESLPAWEEAKKTVKR